MKTPDEVFGGLKNFLVNGIDSLRSPVSWPAKFFGTVLVASVGLMLVYAVAYVILELRAETEAAPAKIVAMVNTANETPQKLEAFLRHWPKVETVCYDTSLDRYFAFLRNEEINDDGVKFQGWHMIEVVMVKMQNGTYLLKSQGSWDAVRPNVTGLACADSGVQK